MHCSLMLSRSGAVRCCPLQSTQEPYLQVGVSPGATGSSRRRDHIPPRRRAGAASRRQHGMAAPAGRGGQAGN